MITLPQPRAWLHIRPVFIGSGGYLMMKTTTPTIPCYFTTSSNCVFWFVLIERPLVAENICRAFNLAPTTVYLYVFIFYFKVFCCTTNCEKISWWVHNIIYGRKTSINSIKLRNNHYVVQCGYKMMITLSFNHSLTTVSTHILSNSRVFTVKPQYLRFNPKCQKT